MVLQRRKVFSGRRLGWIPGTVALCWMGSVIAPIRFVRAQETTVATQPAPKPSIFDAINSGNANQVAQFLKDDPSQAKALNNSGESALLRAVRNANVEIVKLLLAAKTDPNALDYFRQSALSVAMDSNNVEMVGALADSGADLNGFDREGRTPLTRSTNGWSQEIPKLLLQKGAKPDVLDQRGMLPLDAAVMSGSQETITLYLENGASVAGHSVNGSTPLHAAVWHSSSELIKSLLQKGANPNAATRDGDTPLHLAAVTFNDSVPTLLAAGADANRRDAQGDLPLHLALRRLNSDLADETVKSLYPTEFNSYGYNNGSTVISDEHATTLLTPLIAKSDINARDRLGFSPLLLAILARQAPVRELINARQPRADSTTQLFNAIAGSDNATVDRILKEKPFLVYFRLPDGTTLLHVAALWGARGSAELLMQKGADVNARDARGMTPLRLCAGRASGTYAKREQIMVKLLLDHKAQVDARDAGGITPLLGAARAGNYDTVAQLVEAKANTQSHDNTGRTVLHWLSQSQDKANGPTAALLLTRGAESNVYDKDGNTALILAVQARHIDLVKALLAKGFNPNQTDFNAQTPLTLVANNFWGDSDETEPLVSALLDAGADPNITSPYNDSILTRAVQSNKKNLVTLLLDHNANPNGIRTGGGSSPLVAAIYGNNKDIIALLLDKGADPLLDTNNGENPLVVAQRTGNKEIVALLQAKADAQKKS